MSMRLSGRSSKPDQHEMPSKGKGKSKASGKLSSVSKSKQYTIDPPLPFSRAPSNLEPFLSKLSKKHVYITHIDSMSWEFKRKIFAVPLLMNITVIGLLLLRISIIGPHYMSICFSIMGHNNETTMTPENMPWGDLGYAVLRRAATFMLDLLLYIFIWPWPRDFFAGSGGNPVSWRFGVGFREKEIIVRRSRKWDMEIGNVVEEESAGRHLFLATVRQAVSPAWMYEKTSYLMMNKEWDLEWEAMVLATQMVDQKKIPLEDFKTTVYVYNKEFGWVIFEAADASGSKKEEEGRQKITAFKEELTAIGKENLFFRWIELMQFESSQPGGFGPKQQVEAARKAKEMFEAQGVDFDRFWAKIGGMEGMPGMD